MLSRDLRLGIATLLLFAAVTAAFPQFARPDNLAGVLNDSAILILLALGQMLVILTRGIDLSVAANLALCGMIAALFNRHFPDAGALSTVAIALVCGALLGACNGLLVWKLRLPPIVVTLGTMSIFRGAIYQLSGGVWVNDNEMSPAFLDLVRYRFLGLTTLAWTAVIAALAAFICLRYLRTGRDLYAAGGNPSAATAAGIDPGRMQFIAYTICGAIAGVCGYLWVARFAVAYTDIALGFELEVIAACLIGGVAIAGGIGTVTGVLLGCLFIGVIRNALPLVGISPFWQMYINGVVITVAALMSARQRTEKRSILEAERA
ncbi:rhamnose transport system permease protein [Povalibacter uvarum]|uniref:Rhamnose transport system permease protein n=1 Tax=Povalibacter uvarum TaxID=732238 RepID=A0A841HTC8_9GAMM|nr:ABC transporter permease [Povalibacter uvarum]MBB6095470.1 rhamnose transport system permease protein [Povalibacter uvarum]